MSFSRTKALIAFLCSVLVVLLLIRVSRSPQMVSVQGNKGKESLRVESLSAKSEYSQVPGSRLASTSSLQSRPVLAKSNISKELPETSCHGHVELCYLRQLLERTSGEKLNGDIYDMSPLYKFKTHMFLDHPDHHLPDWHGKIPGPKLRQKGRGMREFIDYEALLLGNKKLSLNLPKNTDINGRTCDYDPYKEYEYSYQAYYNNGAVHAYVTETPLSEGKPDKKREMNTIFGNIATTSTKISCALTDFFMTNGTYHIVCPILEPEFKISIQASYISITSWDVNCPDLKAKHLLWDLKTYEPADFSDKKKAIAEISKPGESTTKDCVDSKEHNSGFWLKIPPYFYWTLKSCHYSYNVGSSKLTCLKTKSTIMFGDSHMQNRCDAIHYAYGLPNFRYYYTSNALHLLTNLLDVYEETLNGKISPNILIMNAGAHDLRDITVTSFIASFEDIFTMIKKFKALQKPPRMIWIETTPTTHNGFHGRHMTNLVVKGTNDWIDHQMKNLGVELLYAHDIASPMLSEHRGYGMHFYHYLGSLVQEGQKVNVGGATTSILLNMICPGP